MAKIPTYTSQRTPTGSVKRPNLPDYSVDIAQKAVKYANKVLDIQAEEEGLQQGFEEIDQGTQTIEQAEQVSSFTIRGSAYKKGARNAYIAKTKTELESQLTELYANTELNANSEMFNEKVNEIREGITANTPSSLAPALLPEIDKVLGNYSNLVRQNEIELEDNQNTTTLLDRFETVILPRMEKQILAGEIVDNDFGEALAILEDLRDRNKITNDTFLKNKNILVSKIITPKFLSELNSTENKAQFLEDLQDGNLSEEIMQKIYDDYGDEYEEVFGEGSFPIVLEQDTKDSIISEVEATLTDQSKQFKTERTVYSDKIGANIDRVISDGGLVANEIDFDEMMAGADAIGASQEYKDALAYAWKEGALVSYYTKNIKQKGLKDIDASIEEIDAEILRTKDEYTPDSQMKLDALDKAKTKLANRKNAILEQVAGGNMYAVTSIAQEHSQNELFFNENGTRRDFRTLNIDDLKARRELVALHLGLNNGEGLPLFDVGEIETLKAGFDNPTSGTQLIQAVQTVQSLGIENNVNVMGELDLSMEQEALFMLSGDTQSFMAEAIVLKGENKTKLGESYNAIDDSVFAFFTKENIKGNPFEENRVGEIYKTLAAHAMARGADQTTANKVAEDYINKAFHFKDIEIGSNEQTILFPKSMDSNDIDQTIGYITEVMENPVKYGLDIPSNISASDINFADTVILERNGDFLIPVQSPEFAGDNALTQSFGGFRISHPSETGNHTVEVLRIAINPEKRQQPNSNNIAHKGFTFETDQTIGDAKLKREDITILGVTTSENIMSEDQTEFIQHYFNYAHSVGYTETVDDFAFNVANDFANAKAITGITAKNITNPSWTDDEFEYLAQFEALEGLNNPDVRDYVIAEWEQIVADGGYETLRTGKKLSPIASLYVLVEDAEFQLGVE
jgi:hypothetical protein